MANRLLTDELVKVFETHQLYSQDDKKKDATCICRFRIGNIRWYVLEGQQEGNDYTIFSIVVGTPETEYGYASLNEMASLAIKTGLISYPVARVTLDTSFVPQKLGDIDDVELQLFLSRMYD